MTKLSEHFTVEEMIYSDTAKARKISNQPTEAHLKVLKHTCEYCLEPLRKLLGEVYGNVSIVVTSGYRGEALNKAVSGVKTSQHCTGEAVDFKVYKKNNGIATLVSYKEVYGHIKQWVKAGKLSVDQCILEYSGSAVWVHISHSAWGKTKDRKQFLIYTNGKYVND